MSAPKADLLILDDDSLGLRALTRALSSRYAVRATQTTAEALAAVATACPEILLCDYDLGGETSAGFLRILSAAYPAVWRVLYSGSGDGVAELLADQLVDRVLSKPVANKTLIAAIESRPKK